MFLARQGVSTVVCEKGQFAGEQSSRNWGWVRRMGRDERELPLIVEAMRLWEGMQSLVGADVGYRRTGILYLCEDESDVAYHEGWLQRAGEFAFDTRIVRGEALWRHCCRVPRERSMQRSTRPATVGLNLQKAAPAIARAAAAAGATLIANCAVREIETGGGKVSGVVTEHGRIACRTVVVAGGVWSTKLLRTLGLRLPQLGVRASVLRTAPVDGGPDGAAWGENFAYRKRLDGGYTIANGSQTRHDIVADSFRYFADFLPAMRLNWRDLRLGLGATVTGLPMKGRAPSPFEQTRILDPLPLAWPLASAFAAMKAAFPVLERVPVVQQWAGMIDATPDAIPVISTVRITPRPGDRDRLFRPWFRDRPRCWAPCSGSCHRGHADR